MAGVQADRRAGEKRVEERADQRRLQASAFHAVGWRLQADAGRRISADSALMLHSLARRPLAPLACMRPAARFPLPTPRARRLFSAAP